MVSQEEEERIVELWKKGYSIRDICRMQHHSATTVCDVLRKYGLTSGRKRGGGASRIEELRRRLGELEAELERRERELAGLRRKSKVLGALCFVEALFVLMLALLL